MVVWRQFANTKLGANLPQPLVGKPTFFMVSCTSSMVEIVHKTIKNGLAPLEVGLEFSPNGVEGFEYVRTIL